MTTFVNFRLGFAFGFGFRSELGGLNKVEMAVYICIKRSFLESPVTGAQGCPVAERESGVWALLHVYVSLVRIFRRPVSSSGRDDSRSTTGALDMSVDLERATASPHFAHVRFANAW